MFTQMRSILGIAKTIDILEHVESLPENEQPMAQNAIEKIEREAMES